MTISSDSHLPQAPPSRGRLRHFSPRADLILRAIVLAGVVSLGAIGWAGWSLQVSPYLTQQDVVIDQPVPFSHQHHVGGLGIDCRFCHASVEISANAGLPATNVCMTCHSQIWNNAPMLQPVRDAWASGVPIQWNRVNAIPDYVYFNHSIHIAKGVGCISCHGRVNEMPLIRQATSMTMSWCLDCHRHPEQYLQPRETVFDPTYLKPNDQATLGHALVDRYQLRSTEAMTNCSTCHR